MFRENIVLSSKCLAICGPSASVLLAAGSPSVGVWLCLFTTSFVEVTPHGRGSLDQLLATPSSSWLPCTCACVCVCVHTRSPAPLFLCQMLRRALQHHLVVPAPGQALLPGPFCLNEASRYKASPGGPEPTAASRWGLVGQMRITFPLSSVPSICPSCVAEARADPEERAPCPRSGTWEEQQTRVQGPAARLRAVRWPGAHPTPRQ